MGTVLGTTLGIAFSTLDLPASLENQSVRNIASTGSSGLATQVQEIYSSLGDRLELSRPDQENYTTLSSDPDMPESFAAQIEEFSNSGRGDISSIAESLRSYGDNASAQLSSKVREGFTSATRRIYTLTFIIMILANIATLRIPEIPLRKTHDNVSNERTSPE